MRPPRICGCGHRVPSGARCACQLKADAERKARFDRARPNASERGYGSKWRAARAEFLKTHPKCTRCGAPATIVDHVTPHRGDKKLMWRRSNWQPLCVPCHSGWKQSIEKSSK